jgi:hypothetical protein
MTGLLCGPQRSKQARMAVMFSEQPSHAPPHTRAVSAWNQQVGRLTRWNSPNRVPRRCLRANARATVIPMPRAGRSSTSRTGSRSKPSLARDRHRKLRYARSSRSSGLARTISRRARISSRPIDQLARSENTQERVTSFHRDRPTEPSLQGGMTALLAGASPITLRSGPGLRGTTFHLSNVLLRFDISSA